MDNKDNILVYVGWIYGNKDDYRLLRDLGVKGIMKWNEYDNSRVIDLQGRSKKGYFDYCECTKSILDKLETEYPSFWRGSFSPVTETEYRKYLFENFGENLGTGKGRLFADKILRDGLGRITYIPSNSNTHSGHSVCGTCSKDMPICWDVVCYGCNRTFCYDCVESKCGYWLCLSICYDQTSFFSLLRRKGFRTMMREILYG